MQLNQRQRRFCEEYAVSGNGTQSAIKAGYKEKAARVTASELLTKPNIREYLKELQKPQEDERKTYIELINGSREKAANKLIALMDCPVPSIAIRACENILQLDKITDDKPENQNINISITRDSD